MPGSVLCMPGAVFWCTAGLGNVELLSGQGACRRVLDDDGFRVRLDQCIFGEILDLKAYVSCLLLPGMREVWSRSEDFPGTLLYSSCRTFNVLRDAFAVFHGDSIIWSSPIP